MGGLVLYEEAKKFRFLDQNSKLLETMNSKQKSRLNLVKIQRVCPRGVRADPGIHPPRPRELPVGRSEVCFGRLTPAFLLKLPVFCASAHAACTAECCGQIISVSISVMHIDLYMAPHYFRAPFVHNFKLPLLRAPCPAGVS